MLSQTFLNFDLMNTEKPDTLKSLAIFCKNIVLFFDKFHKTNVNCSLLLTFRLVGDQSSHL